MALSYPDYFPSQYLGPIVKAAAAGEAKYRAALGSARSIPKLREIETDFLTDIAVAFVEAARAAVQGAENGYTCDRILYDLDEQIRRTIVFLDHDFKVTRL